MTPACILNTATRLYGLRPGQLLGPDISRRTAWPRIATTTMCQEMTDATSALIGKAMHRDHSYIFYARHRLPQLMTQRQDFAALYTLFRHMLEADLHIYISGPHHGSATAAFCEVADEIRRIPGCCPVNPFTTGAALRWQPGFNSLSQEVQLGEYRRAALANLIGCEAMIQMPGWARDADAKLEHSVAKSCNMRIYPDLPAFLKDQRNRQVPA